MSCSSYHKIQYCEYILCQSSMLDPPGHRVLTPRTTKRQAAKRVQRTRLILCWIKHHTNTIITHSLHSARKVRAGLDMPTVCSTHLHNQCVVLAGWHQTKWLRLSWIDWSADRGPLQEQHTRHQQLGNHNPSLLITSTQTLHIPTPPYTCVYCMYVHAVHRIMPHGHKF